MFRTARSPLFPSAVLVLFGAADSWVSARKILGKSDEANDIDRLTPTNSIKADPKSG
jgi:hypothetical protein